MKNQLDKKESPSLFSCNKRSIFYHLCIVLILLFPLRSYTQETTAILLPRHQYSINEQIMIARVVSMRNSDSAIALLQQAVQRSVQAFEYPNMVEGLISLGAAYTNKGAYDTAEKCYLQILSYTGKLRHPIVATCRALNNLGNTYTFKGDYKKAMEYYMYAAKIAEQNEGKDTLITDHLTRIYNNTGSLLQQIGQYQKALHYFDLAEITANKIKAPARLSSIFVNKAMAYSKLGDLEKAWKYNMSAYTLALQIEFIQKKQQKPVQSTQTQFLALKGLADILLVRQKPQQAIPYLQKALRIEENINPYYIILATHALGKAYLSLKNYRDAEQYLLLALDKADATGIPDCSLNIHKDLSLLYEYTQKYLLAFKHQRAYFSLKDSLLNKEKTHAVNLMEVKYRTAEKEKDISQKKLLINKQKRILERKNIWIYGTAGCAIALALLLISYYKVSQHKQKINLLKAMIEGEERERTRIGQELHDGIGGRMVAINMNFGAVQKRYEAFEGSAELERIMNMMEDTTEEVRKTAHNLIPDILSRYSFPQALSMYCEQVSNDKLRVQLQETTFDVPNKTLELILYRIIQELVQNIVKHAKATEAVVEISQHEKELNIIVEDNGVGFNIHEKHKGIGLHNIRSRVKMLQGNVIIESAQGIGTSISINFDIAKLKTLLSNEHQDSYNG